MRIAKVLFLLVCTQIQAISQPRQRLALVIGVQSYSSVPPLRNALNDAREISNNLSRKGFRVIESYDPKSKKDIQGAIKKYFDAIRQYPETEGVFYYSGHAVQVDGINFLMPADANPQLKADLEDQCVKMDYLISTFEQAGNVVNILILDACRNNPFPGFSRSVERGLNQITAPRGSIVCYATSPGSVASDGEGENGLFTSKFLKYMDQPGLTFEQMFKRVIREVEFESGNKQSPWMNLNYSGDFYFNTPSEGITSYISESPRNSSTPVRSVVNVETFSTVNLFGKQWMKENLKVMRYRNGDLIPQVQNPAEWSTLTSGAWCYYENLDNDGVEKMGILYNGYAVMDPRGLAPEGWRIATQQDWNELSALGEQNKLADLLKSADGWFGAFKGKDVNGFAALPAGIRFHNGTFSLRGKSAYWWVQSTSGLKVKIASYSRSTITDTQLNLGYGLSVRCVRE